jgi:hypothetical protein
MRSLRIARLYDVRPGKPWRRRVIVVIAGRHGIGMAPASVRFSDERASWELARGQQRTVPLLLSSACGCETLPFDDRTLTSMFSYRGRVEDMGRQIHARYRDRPVRRAGHLFRGSADRGLRFCSLAKFRDLQTSSATSSTAC